MDWWAQAIIWAILLDAASVAIWPALLGLLRKVAGKCRGIIRR